MPACGVHTVCLCMIVKNEVELLPRCLESARGVVDEVVVVDTGSADDTVAVAKRFGAHVYHHPWRDSFSEARNYALQFVEGEWVLQLDADEELERADAPLLRQVVRGQDYHAVYLSILNYMPQGRTQLYYPRLFRRGKAHYEGIVHNQLVYEGRPCLTQIRIYHYGYALSQEKMNAKYERTTRLLRRQLQEDPQDVFAWYNLIRAYRNRRQFELAARTGQEVVEDLCFKDKENLFLMICYDVACSFLELGDLRNAEFFCKKALGVDRHYIDALFTLGVVYHKMCQWQKAVLAFQDYLHALDAWRASPRLHHLSLGSLDHEFLAHALLGECLLHMEAIPQALESFKRALSLFETNTRTWPAEVRPHPDILLQMGNAAIRLQRFEQALSLFQQCLDFGAHTPQLFNNLAGCYARLGDLEKARIAYEQALHLNPHYEEAQNNLRALQRLRKAKAERFPLPALT